MTKSEQFNVVSDHITSIFKAGNFADFEKLRELSEDCTMGTTAKFVKSKNGLSVYIHLVK